MRKQKMQINMLVDYTSGYSWAFKHFRDTRGYANLPLDGLWARASYNQGHSGPRYGTGLPDEDKRALIEYLKTL